MKNKYNEVIQEFERLLDRKLTEVESLFVQHSYIKGFSDGKEYERITS